jgi:hypothetical protein
MNVGLPRGATQKQAHVSIVKIGYPQIANAMFSIFIDSLWYRRPPSCRSRIRGRREMLDKLEKTRDLIAILEAAVPFEVALMPELIEQLARQQKPVVLKPIETVSKIEYLGDMGGIVCCVEPQDTKSMIVVSLTHVRVSRKLPFATAVLDYQKHRVKKLRRQVRGQRAIIWTGAILRNKHHGHQQVRRNRLGTEH